MHLFLQEKQKLFEVLSEGTHVCQDLLQKVESLGESSRTIVGYAFKHKAELYLIVCFVRNSLTLTKPKNSAIRNGMTLKLYDIRTNVS
jgi:hypothetical protein